MSRRSTSPLVLAVAVALVLVGAEGAAAAKKGQRISVADDPSLKEGSPGIVLVEVSDFQ